MDTSRQRSKMFCGHCSQYVSKSTYYRHRDTYYNKEKREWSKEPLEPMSSYSSSESGLSPIEDEPHSLDHGDYSLPGFESKNTESDLVSDSYSQSSSTDSDETTSSEELSGHQEDYPEVWISTDSESSEEESSQPLHDQLRLMYIFLLFWQFAYKVSSNAIRSLLRFLKYFLLIIGNAFHCHEISEFGEHFPATLNSLHKKMCMDTDYSFTKYIVCPKCHSLYLYEDCVIARANGSFDIKRCSHVAYPNHPHRNQRLPCNEVLMKKIRTRKGYKVVPIKVYPYYSLQKQFERLFQRRNFASDCEKWRIRSDCIQDGYLGDIYDGAVWKRFNSSEGLNFLTCPYSYLLTLNVDWFQPFDRGVYSVGAIYLTIQNLPRAERFKSENILLIGIIPGPKEPKRTINSYLTPLVIELKRAWDGLLMTSAQGTQVRVRLALSCVSCDIPASRKVVGFLGHNATLGCNHCYKKFKIRVGKVHDFSGFDRENWIMRDEKKHRRDVHKILQEVTKSGLKSSESKLGVRYSVLLGLNYFDPVAFTAVDVMHNLYLGSAKHMVEIWIELKLIKKDDFTKIDHMIQSFNMPADCGRLPLNLSSSHGAFTASQWKNWITIYSPVVLKGILPRDHLQCWLLFVHACVLMSKRFILNREIDTADLFLLQFCRRFEALYGEVYCTPNLHLHLHLRDTFKNFGPAHAFWCFPFERYNGLLGSYHTNRKSIEVQVMTQFCHEQEIRALKIPSDSVFLQHLPAYHDPDSLLPSADPSTLLRSWSLAQSNLNTTSSFVYDPQTVTLLPPYTELVLESHHKLLLSTVYKELYPDQDIHHITPFIKRYGRITIYNDIIGSTLPGQNNHKSSVIMAHWPSNGHSIRHADCSRLNVGIVQYFFKHSISVNTVDSLQYYEHVFAYVFWKQAHPQIDYFGTSATVCSNMYEPLSPCCFIPVQRIACRCAHALISVNFNEVVETVFIACPIPLRFCI